MLSSTQLDTTTFEIEIYQDGAKVEIKNELIKLNKKEFQIKVNLINTEGVFVNSSFTKDYFSIPLNKKVKDLDSWGARTMVEENFNTDKDLAISSESFCYWFYDSTMDWHRFDKDIQRKGNTTTGTITVSILDDIDHRKKIELSQVSKPVYLVFLTRKENKNTPIELERSRLKIVWK
jgi:hypothetical protein